MKKNDFLIFKPKILKEFPQEEKRVLLDSEKILRQKFEVLSRSVKLIQKTHWPLEHFTKLNRDVLADFDSPKYLSDVKLSWELSKHLHLQDLAKAYLVSGDEKLTQEFIREIQNWLKNNPYEHGVNWTQGLIASHRAISWIVALSVFSRSPLVTEDFLSKILNSLEQHALFIEKTYEFGMRSSNHLLGELCTQIFISAVFFEFKNAKKRLDFAIEHLIEELSKQIYPDGVDYEKSLSYQRVVLEFLYLILILEKRKVVKLPSLLLQTTEKMTEFMLHMTQPSGHLQPISDSDGARVFVLGQDDNDLRPHLALAAWLFGRGDFKYAAQDRLGPILWFLTDKEIQDYLQIKEKFPKETSRAFKTGGYWVSRRDWSKDSPWLFFDCGLMGLGKWPPDLITGVHGHSDILNFGLALGGETFITDKGSYSYTTERPYHQYFRSAKAHNLAIIDDQDQNIIEPLPWMSRQIASPQNPQDYFSNEIDYFSGEHTGYLRLRGKMISRREILFFKKENFIILKDSFLGKGIHRITEYFHLMPNLKVKEYSNGYRIYGKKENLMVQPLFSSSKKVVIGQSEPVEGWYAPTYGKKLPAAVLKFSFETNGSASRYFLLDWQKTEDRGRKTEDFISLFEETMSRIKKPKIIMLVTNDVSRDPRVQKESLSAKEAGFDVKILAYFLTSLSKKLKKDELIRRIPHQEPFFKKRFQAWLARKIMNIYYRHKILAAVLSSLGKIKVTLRTKVLKMVEPSVSNQINPSAPQLNQPRKLSIFSLIYYYYRLNRILISEGSKISPDIVHANDLDTLLAGYFIKRKTGAKLAYDAHEIWWEQKLPHIARRFFRILEKRLLKKVDYFISVNGSVAETILGKNQNVPTEIIYNCPPYREYRVQQARDVTVIYQGLFLSNRGIQEIISAGKYLGPNIKIIIRGFGYQDVIEDIKRRTANIKNIFIADPVSPDRTVEYAHKADIGIIAYMPKNLNNKFCTPNKLYEYMMAGLALVVSDLIELRKIIKKYQNGLLINPKSPRSIARAINYLARNPKILKKMKENSLKAAKDFNWENEEKKLIDIYRRLLESKESKK